MDKTLGLIGISTKAGKVAFGTEQVLDSIQKNKVKLVIVAKDASKRTIDKFELLCKKQNIKFVIYGSIELLSKAIGKQNKAIIAIRDNNLSEEIIKTICGGETVG